MVPRVSLDIFSACVTTGSFSWLQAAHTGHYSLAQDKVARTCCTWASVVCLFAPPSQSFPSETCELAQETAVL